MEDIHFSATRTEYPQQQKRHYRKDTGTFFKNSLTTKINHQKNPLSVQMSKPNFSFYLDYQRSQPSATYVRSTTYQQHLRSGREQRFFGGPRKETGPVCQIADSF